ncbi:hypothetical protein [Actinacidiphila yeochonensis]|uniref:hypothetical protein n=1 Tax=Actinacidiphila yeochonensis TaxID=89050 RepID=UPI000691997F|nr:hypothetical protein [Actinacidiphila yeochonensis]
MREALLGVADAGPFLDTLHELAARMAARAAAADMSVAAYRGGFGGFGPWFWRALPLPVTERVELLRVLVPVDLPAAPPVARAASHRPAGAPSPEATAADAPSAEGPFGDAAEERFLTATARLLRADPVTALPAVCGWLDDDRPLRAARPGPEEDIGALTVARAAQALLYSQHRQAPEALTEALADAAHPAADAVLTALAEDDPAVVCRAVGRWALDDRPERRAAAAVHGALVAARVRRDADREVLRHAALVLLSRPGEDAVHAAALGVLVRDPATRVRYLPAALGRFAARDPALAPATVLAALPTHPEMVLDAFRERLRALEEPPYAVPRQRVRTGQAGSALVAAGRRPDVRSGRGERAGPDTGGASLLTALAGVSDAALRGRVAALVREHLTRRPESAADVARYLELRLEQGAAARPELLPFATALARDHPPRVRAVLLPVFAAPGTPKSRPLRRELLDAALETEADTDVLAAVLTAAAGSAAAQHPLLTRDLVHRVAQLLTRTPDGATRFDRTIVSLAAAHPGFARMLRTWVDDAPWEGLLGPSARRGLLTTG